MPKIRLSGFALAAKSGLGFGSGASGRNRSESEEVPVGEVLPAAAGPDPLDEQDHNLKAVLALLDRVESQVAQSGAKAETVPDDSADRRAIIASLEERLSAQACQIEMLQIQAAEAERIADAESQLAERRSHELRDSLLAEVDAAIARRVAALEQTVAEQSATILALGQRARSFEVNMRKLVDTMEQIAERQPGAPAVETAPAPRPVAVPRTPALKPLPSAFDKQLDSVLAEPPPIAIIGENGFERLLRDEAPSPAPRFDKLSALRTPR